MQGYSVPRALYIVCAENIRECFTNTNLFTQYLLKPSGVITMLEMSDGCKERFKGKDQLIGVAH